MKETKRIGLYIRVSTDKQAREGFSLEGQKNEGIREAKRLYGDNIEFELYVDEGISGKSKSLHKRKALNRMMIDVELGKLFAIITYKVSRLSRSLSDSLKLVEKIHAHKVKFVSIKEGVYGTSDAKLKFHLLASIAEYHREELGENVQLGMTQRALEGHWNGGQVLGYKSINKMLVIGENEADIIRLIFKKFTEDNWGTKKISNYLNTCGYRTKKGKPFAVSSISIIISNPVYKGYIRYNQVINWEEQRRNGKNPDYIVCKGLHDKIIDEETWEKANSLVKKRATGIPRQYSGTFPLTGLSKCPQCGSFMTSCLGSRRKDGTRKRYYVCGAYHNNGGSICSSNSIPADWLEEAVFQRLSFALNSNEIINQLTSRVNQLIATSDFGKTNEKKLLENKLHELETQKKRIQELVLSGSELYTESEALLKISEIRETTEKIKFSIQELGEIEIQANDAHIKSVNAEIIREQLSDFLHLSKKLKPLEFRKLLQTSITKIEASKNNLKNVHFSFIVNMPEGETDPADPLHNKSTLSSCLLRAFYLDQKHYLFVVRFPAVNLHRAVNLLHEHKTHELMR